MTRPSWMGNRGSITILVALMMPAWLFLADVVMDRVRFMHELESFERAQERRLLAEFRAFDRGLFDRFGLLGVMASEDDLDYDACLGDTNYLASSIEKLMVHRLANDMVVKGIKTLSGSSEISSVLRIRRQVLNTLAQKDTINRQISRGEIPNPKLLKSLAAGVVRNACFFRFPYADPWDIASLGGETLIQLELSHVFRQIQWSTLDSLSDLELGGLERKALHALYAVDYLGYSSNQSKKELFSAEYVLTGLPLPRFQRPVVQAGLLSLRTGLNAVSLAADPKHRQAYLLRSGGDFRLQLLYLLIDAVRLATEDLDLLEDGRTVPLLKSPKQLTEKSFKTGLRYKDYLTVLLMTLPDELMLDRIGEAVLGISGYYLPMYYTALSLEECFCYKFRWMGGRYEKTFRFHAAF